MDETSSSRQTTAGRTVRRSGPPGGCEYRGPSLSPRSRTTRVNDADPDRQPGLSGTPTSRLSSATTSGVSAVLLTGHSHEHHFSTPLSACTETRKPRSSSCSRSTSPTVAEHRSRCLRRLTSVRLGSSELRRRGPAGHRLGEPGCRCGLRTRTVGAAVRRPQHAGAGRGRTECDPGSGSGDHRPGRLTHRLRYRWRWSVA